MPLGLALAALAAMFLLLWPASLVLRDASIVDRFWGLAFVLVGATCWVGTDEPTLRARLALLLTTAWALRLSLHITLRNFGQGEDPRYVAMRRHWGARFGLVSLGTVFGLQAFLAWVVSLPLQAAVTSAAPSGLTPLDAAGVVAWIAGFAFESVGDRQLARFRSDPANRGKVMDRGLWAWTRHPNYFGDALQWWGIGLLAAATGAWWTAVGPAVMTFLLMRVSGVPMLEKQMKRSRPGYEEYARRTSAFVPWPPRRG